MTEPLDNSAAPQYIEPGEGQYTGHNVSPEETARIQQRQRARSKVMAIGLISLCVLFFLITIVKIGLWG